jgi:hypothetical protein
LGSGFQPFSRLFTNNIADKGRRKTTQQQQQQQQNMVQTGMEENFI